MAGLFHLEVELVAEQPLRAFVFLDWQNVYMRAREAFFEPRSAPVAKGQVDPVDLAHVLVKDYGGRHPGTKVALDQIHIYRGRPLQSHDSKGYDAFRRQDGSWRRNNKIRTHYRDLRYPHNWGHESCEDKPREKGVDVELATDLVTMGLDSLYDLGIVMSADYDLVPAVDYMIRRHISRGGPAIEVAAWKGDREGTKPLRIRLNNRSLYCIWLDRAAYWGVEDERDYRAAPRGANTGPRPGPAVL